jgi:hypothetical protein
MNTKSRPRLGSPVARWTTRECVRSCHGSSGVCSNNWQKKNKFFLLFVLDGCASPRGCCAWSAPVGRGPPIAERLLCGSVLYVVLCKLLIRKHDFIISLPRGLIQRRIRVCLWVCWKDVAHPNGLNVVGPGQTSPKPAQITTFAAIVKKVLFA